MTELQLRLTRAGQNPGPADGIDGSLSPHVLEIKLTPKLVQFGTANCSRVETQLDDPCRVWKSILKSAVLIFICTIIASTVACCES